MLVRSLSYKLKGALDGGPRSKNNGTALKQFKRQLPGIFLGMIGRDSSVSSIIRLHVDIFVISL
jgi:hypothetical protein